MPTTPHLDPTAMLRGAGMRVTKPREAVIGALAEHPHASADEVFAAIAPHLPGTSMQAVYHVLGDLAGRGLARRIEPAGSSARYELRVDDNHHHIVCTRCGAIADVDCVVGHAPCLTPSQSHGFALAQAEVTFWGLCEDCLAASEDLAPAGA